MYTHLVVTVDTEEEGIWDGNYKRRNNSVKHLYQLNRLQDLFYKYKVKPTYLVDYAVLLDNKAVNCLKKVYKNGASEIGSHLHTWCTPPFEEELNIKNTYACNLPKSLVKKK
ncbi:MAG: hypothetical protein NC935_08310 [Candidatus Omnitrophica bacterium]|nr:hypothetical protein [Candidatus Omnitrophota bacterium]